MLRTASNEHTLLDNPGLKSRKWIGGKITWRHQVAVRSCHLTEHKNELLGVQRQRKVVTSGLRLRNPPRTMAGKHFLTTRLKPSTDRQETIGTRDNRVSDPTPVNTMTRDEARLPQNLVYLLEECSSPQSFGSGYPEDLQIFIAFILYQVYHQLPLIDYCYHQHCPAARSTMATVKKPEDVIGRAVKHESYLTRLCPLLAAPPRTRASAFLQKKYKDLESKKTFLEGQNNPSHAKKIGRIAVEMQELKLMMHVVDLEATLASGDLDDMAKRSRQEELENKNEELRKHQEKMEKPQTGPVDKKNLTSKLPVTSLDLLRTITYKEKGAILLERSVVAIRPSLIQAYRANYSAIHAD
ncbi:hypothetical protein V8F33_005806 [Rhypophila sp. PSN 637]